MIYVNIEFTNFGLFSLKNLRGPAWNKQDFEIPLHIICISLIHADICHQIHLCGDLQGLVTLCITDSRGDPDINYKMDHIIKEKSKDK